MNKITRYIIIGVGILLLVGVGIILLSKIKTKEYYKLTKFDSVYTTTGDDYVINRLEDYEYFYIELGTKNTFTMKYKLTETNDKNQIEYTYTGTYTKDKTTLVLKYDNFVDEMDDDEPRECIYNYNEETKLWERSQFINITDGEGTSVSRYTLVQNLKVTRNPK